MHRSRIGVVLIDHGQSAFEASLAFWRGATGRESTAEGEFQSLGDCGGFFLALQRLGAGTPSRVHLDIETDDVVAETARLVALGAKVVEKRAGYAILREPGGLPFCVVPVQTGDLFTQHATTWE